MTIRLPLLLWCVAVTPAVWRMVLGWLQPGRDVPVLAWTSTVRPTFTRDAALPPDAARRAIARGIDWHTNERHRVLMLPEDQIKLPAAQP